MGQVDFGKKFQPWIELMAQDGAVDNFFFCHRSSFADTLNRAKTAGIFFIYAGFKLKKIVGSNNFSAQFIKIISHYKKIGNNINVLQHNACLVVNPIMVGNFNCSPVAQTL